MAISTKSGKTYYPATSGALPGGVGTVTVGLSTTDGDVVTAPDANGIVEVASGSYVATRTAPTVTVDTSYVVVWHDSRNTAALSDTEALVVFAGAVRSDLGLYYTSADNLRDFLDLTSDQLSDAACAQPIRRAQRDIDVASGRWLPYDDTGLKFASDTMIVPLTDAEARALSQATCAQVEYRMTVGDDFMIREQYASQSGPGYGTSGTLKKVTGMAYAYLQPHGFLKLTGRVQSINHHRLPDSDNNNVLPLGMRYGDFSRSLGRFNVA